MNADDLIQVAIAAASDVECAQIETMLAATHELSVIGTGLTTALADLLAQVSPDVLVLDLGSDPAPVLAQIADGIALPRTVLLAMDVQPERQLLQLGVRAVLPERLPAVRLRAAVKAVAAGLIVLDANSAAIASPEADEQRRESAGVEELTVRETEILQLLAEGLPNKEIARALDISEHTVKFHLSAVFGKLGSTNRTEAVAIGIRRGLVMI